MKPFFLFFDVRDRYPMESARRLRRRLLRAVRRRRSRWLELFLGNPEPFGHERIAFDSHDALRGVLTDHRAELEAFGVSAGDDPCVRHLRMNVDDEVAALRDLVVTG